jgi:hypothetical protein
VWIAYRDGTLIRLHHAACFPSVWKMGADAGRSLEDLLDAPAVVRCRVGLPPTSTGGAGGAMVVPLPRHHPSPLAPCCWGGGHEPSGDGDEFPGLLTSDEDGETDGTEVAYEALVFGKSNGSNGGGTEQGSTLPTFAFYTSEGSMLHDRADDQGTDAAWSSKPGDNTRVLGSVVGSTKALVGSAIGAALRWGRGSSPSMPRNEPDSDDDGDYSQSSEEEPASSPFPSLWNRPVELYPCNELHDAPRQIEFCSIDPDGTLAAATDTLGRVLLIDLESKQLVRIWKGFRQATCYWLQSPTSDQSAAERRTSMLHLVIHSKQRRVVEVWHVRHGSRISSMQVGRDAQILPCTLWSLSSQLAACFLLHSNVPGTSLNQLEMIGASEQKSSSTQSRQTSMVAAPSTPPRTAALRLQRLQQILSATNVEYSRRDVQEALYEIKSLEDLATAIDLLATGSVLEERLGVEGSEFHRSALAYCRDMLSEATQRRAKDVRSNPHVRILSHKIDYHTQVRFVFVACSFLPRVLL